MRVLITGAAGHIGSVLADRLSSQHDLVGLDLHSPSTHFPGVFLTGDCAEPEVAGNAVRGVDAVVHLAGVPHEADLPTILHSHVETTAALLDAMVQSQVRRMVYASSNHAVGMVERASLVGTDTPTRPDTFYGVGKVAAEALLSLYSDRYGLSCVAMRIGSFLEAPVTRRHLSTWLSYGDCAAMVRAALEADFEGYRAIFGISANRDRWWELEPGRALGYEPRDDAADYEASIPAREDDHLEAQHVGGEYATAAHGRRPFDATTGGETR